LRSYFRFLRSNDTATTQFAQLRPCPHRYGQGCHHHGSKQFCPKIYKATPSQHRPASSSNPMP